MNVQALPTVHGILVMYVAMGVANSLPDKGHNILSEINCFANLIVFDIIIFIFKYNQTLTINLCSNTLWICIS